MYHCVMANKRGPKTDPMLGDLKQRTVMLDDLTLDMLRVVGGGNVSNGIRIAARREYQRYQAMTDTPTEPDAARA